MLSDINTDRIREVMQGLEDLAVIEGDENPTLDMYGAELTIDKTKFLKREKNVCFGCWLNFLLNKNSRTFYHYTKGAELFAEYIGEGSAFELKQTLAGAPNLWGNPIGDLFAISSRAYKDDYNRNLIRLKEVTKHWRKFADRLDEHRRGRQ